MPLEDASRLQAPAGRNAIVGVAVVEDVHDIREGLGILIAGTEGFRCMGTYGTMELALRGIDRDLPAVALLDIGLPGISGIEGARILRDRHPTLAILMLTVYDDDERIFDALCAGACGYLLKKVPPARLLEGLREAAEGGAPMSPEVARRVVALFREFRPPTRSERSLSPHELRLLEMLVEGHSYKTAAAAMGITTHTVSFHLRRIYEKLHVHTKSEAVARALRERLVR